MISNTDTALIRLYYENFGFAPNEVASLVGQPIPVVEALIKQRKFQAPAEAKMESDKKEALLEHNLDKQIALEPYYARAEAVLLGKLTDLAETIDPRDPAAPASIAAITKAFKDLRSPDTQAKLNSSAGEAGGVTVQILNQL